MPTWYNQTTDTFASGFCRQRRSVTTHLPLTYVMIYLLPLPCADGTRRTYVLLRYRMILLEVTAMMPELLLQAIHTTAWLKTD